MDQQAVRGDEALIRETKRKLRAQLPNLEAVWKEVEEAVKPRAAEIKALGSAAIPEIHISAINSNKANSDEIKNKIKEAGVVVIRGVAEQAEVAEWNDTIADYIHSNDYINVASSDNIKQYFAGLDAKKPQMFDVYWSEAQIKARQNPNLKVARDYINSLWRYKNDSKWFFDPKQQIDYCDRVRMRQPGDNTLGLSPHLDAGSIERWVQDGYQNVYANIFSGNWQKHDAFDGEHRVVAEEFPAPNVSTSFRTYQGWTALTKQGKGDGTLQVIPMIKESIAYLLLRPLLDDVAEDDLCGALRAKSLPISKEWHATLMEGLISIPTVEAGDTVWWHPDIVHAVEDEHNGSGYSNVFFIGSAPLCEKNARYIKRQKEHFLVGKTPPDFAQNDIEVGFKNRANEASLSALGRSQMGFEAWTSEDGDAAHQAFLDKSSALLKD